ncbi:MAG: transglutaminase family protein [Muribaculaceae bacterium]
MRSGKKLAMIFAGTLIGLASCGGAKSVETAAGEGAASAEPKWKIDACELVHTGEMQKAQQLMDSLSDGEKEQYALQIDSLREIIERIRFDFSVTPEEGVKMVKELVPEADDELIAEWKSKKYLETMMIDGSEMWFIKAARNLRLIDVEDFGLFNKLDNRGVEAEYTGYFKDLMAHDADERGTRNWHRVKITFDIEVEAGAVPTGEMVRVWMPFPYENGRQRNIKLISTSHKATMSEGSVHHTVYMEAPAEKGKPTKFGMELSYEVGGQYFSLDDIKNDLKPYNKESELYRKYTATEYPHIVVNEKMRELAKSIVGEETNPVEQASLIYDWIAQRFPWAGARDYSTIPNIPDYVLENGHGDCGQVSLLNITLLRSLGIPARWESGWMLHPGNKNLHDWGEIYFEGSGWVPCDVSFGRSTKGTGIKDIYKTGTDIYRFATNEGVNGKLSPEKKYIRCETVDFQLGEVEWRGGNLPMQKWSSNLNIDEFKPIK